MKLSCKSYLKLPFSNFRGWTKIYSSDGSEIFNHNGCSHVLGDVEQIPFGGSKFLTLKFHTEHQGSYARSQFALLEQDKYLYSGELAIKNAIFLSLIQLMVLLLVHLNVHYSIPPVW